MTITAGLVIVGGVVFLCLAAPLLGFGNPNAQNLSETLKAPSLHHIFGTDSLGRDVFTRVLYGGRIDFLFAVVVTYASVALGVVIGGFAGYIGRWFDAVAMRVVDVVLAFPFLVLILAVVAAVGPGLKGAYIGVLVVDWAVYARLSRAEMLVAREQQYMMAAQTLGFSTRRIVFKHALRNIVRPSLVFSMADLVLNILLLASLSYLGLGVQPPTPEWGAIIADGQQYLLTSWWIATLPGLVVVLVGIGFSLIGDGLADRFGQDFRLVA